MKKTVLALLLVIAVCSIALGGAILGFACAPAIAGYLNIEMPEINTADATVAPTDPVVPIEELENNFGEFEYEHLKWPNYTEYAYDISIFPTASDDATEMVGIYGAVVKERLEKMQADEGLYFTNHAELDLIDFRTNGEFETTDFNRRLSITCPELEMQNNTMWYPVVFKDGNNTVWVYYVNPEGTLCRSLLLCGDSASNGFGFTNNEHLCTAHTTADEEVIVDKDKDFAATYNNETHVLSIWKHGSVVCEHTLTEMGLSEDVLFVGHCISEGYLFQDGSNLYALTDMGSSRAHHWDNHTLHQVATGVKYVLSDDYTRSEVMLYYAPLLLLEDGSVVFAQSGNNQQVTLYPFEGYSAYGKDFNE